MKRLDVQVHSFHYDCKTEELTVTQSNGTVVYGKVRLGEYNAFKSAVDKAEFLRLHIMPAHQCRNA